MPGNRPKPTTPLYAHTPRKNNETYHDLIDHLEAVANLASNFGKKFNAADICRTLGLAHDLAKADPRFQHYLKEAHAGKTAKKCPHSDPGAKATEQILGPFAWIIQGHHSGLSDATSANNRREAAAPQSVQAAKSLAEKFGLTNPKGHPASKSPLGAEHLLRMCFSALVDADYLDTEAHFSPSVERGNYPSIKEYRQKLDEHLSTLTAMNSEVGRVRREVQKSCVEKATKEQGFFRLTVPTGGGKTLASMLFALHHAERHGLERVIIAIPFTSIIEQTADVFRAIFGNENVLEHHSAVSLDDSENQDDQAVRQRLAAENWDCPIVVTTNVQLFESLLANKPAKCRKLHNIAQSVVVLDEAQGLPARLIQASTDVLGWMVQHAKSSIVFCTASQPNYEGIADVPLGLLNAVEIASNPPALFERLRRVEFNFVGQLSHVEVAERMRDKRQVLTILNTRADSVAVHAALGDIDALYLSTWLCPHHRRRVLAEVNRRLKDGEECRLVSTQVVEAGVDLDFPWVIRAMAPLDSLVQAAGRCNRNGKLDELGTCEVFDLTDGKSPDGDYASAITTTRRFVPDRMPEVGTPAVQAEYTRAYFKNICTDSQIKIGDGGKTTLQKLRSEFDYPKIAKYSALIEDETTSVVIKNYADELVTKTLRAVEFGKSPRLAARELAPYSVSLRPHDLKNALREHLVELDPSGFHVWVGPYSEEVGIGKRGVFEPSDLNA